MKLEGFQRYLLAFFLFLVTLLVILYGRPIYDVQGSLTINEIDVGRNETDAHKAMVVNKNEYLYSCLNELFSKENTDLITPSGLKEEERQNLSICSDTANKRGPHQQVVSFSFYGRINQTRNYFQGIEENAKLMEKIYPKWIMRLYHDIPPLSENTSISKNILNEVHKASNANASTLQGLIRSPQVNLCILQHIYPNLDLCYVGNISGFGKLLGSQGNMWRFLPMADPLVDIFLSRDLDSHLNEREKAAVDDWISSNLTFHIMRDHPYHAVPILAGMWGAITYRDRENLKYLTQELMYRGKKYLWKGLDQSLLKQIIWPVAIGASMQHDSYHCDVFKGYGKMTPWPTQRNKEPYNFVGSRIGKDIHPLLKKCPVQCRPSHRQDWIHC